jgi:hypothetical protein
LSDLHRLPDETIEWLASGVIDHEHRLPALAHQFQRPQCPSAVQITLKFVFAREAIDALQGRTLDISGNWYERVLLTLSIIPP